MPLNELQTQWGRRLRGARTGVGLSLREAARRAQVDKGQLSRAESGRKGLGDGARIRIAAVYGRRVDDLFPYPDTSDLEDACPPMAPASDEGMSPIPMTTAATRSPAPSATGPAASGPVASRGADVRDSGIARGA